MEKRFQEEEPQVKGNQQMIAALKKERERSEGRLLDLADTWEWEEDGFVVL